MTITVEQACRYFQFFALGRFVWGLPAGGEWFWGSWGDGEGLMGKRGKAVPLLTIPAICPRGVRSPSSAAHLEDVTLRAGRGHFACVKGGVVLSSNSQGHAGAAVSARAHAEAKCSWGGGWGVNHQRWSRVAGWYLQSNLAMFCGGVPSGCVGFGGVGGFC